MDAEFRLGRHSVSEIINHPVFTDVVWDELPTSNYDVSVFSLLITTQGKPPLPCICLSSHIVDP